MKIKTRLRAYTLDGLATESTRSLELKMKDILLSKELLGDNEQRTLGQKFGLVRTHFPISKEANTAYREWSRLRNAYTHGSISTFDKKAFKRNYTIIARELNELTKTQGSFLIIVLLILVVLVLAFMFWGY